MNFNYLSTILGDKFEKAGDQIITVSQLESVEVIALYFASLKSRICEEFTPVLLDFYEKVNKGNKNSKQLEEDQNKKFEIVYIAFDKEDSDVKEQLSRAS